MNPLDNTQRPGDTVLYPAHALREITRGSTLSTVGRPA
ncbi:hypothetical protein SAMN05216371_0516 [Streptomyces sp. TLI_053]|nr:hypothetical protein SAMN05216371_0516 [Streptomyces sp. TLI_053]